MRCMSAASHSLRPRSVRHPGTFAGIIEKIPYLKDLGVTAVELLPVFDFDETAVCSERSMGSPCRNYWGYSTIGYFAPQSSYCVEPEIGSHLREFRDLVKALHQGWHRSHSRRGLQSHR